MELTATARGSLDNPTLVGNAEVSEARFSVRDRPVTVKGLSGRMEFSEARIIFHDVHAILNDGRIAMRETCDSTASTWNGSKWACSWTRFP